MAKIILESWRSGLEKVSLSKLQINLLNMSISKSKKNVDLLLDDKIVLIDVDDIELARKFIVQADKIGVNCRMEL